jgi:predicted AAA+ superfamily ATPase
MYNRTLNLKSLIEKSSFFLFGPRATGKSSLIRVQLGDAPIFDLLDSDIYEELLRRPKALGEKILPHEKFVVIDEIQKLPALLDEVHRLMEDRKIRFLLTGSSTNKIKRTGANMLGGRAREAQLFPLTFFELTDFDLLKYLRYGGLPIIWNSTEPSDDLEAYGRTYLAEEIKAEAAVRNYERFVRFMETMALSNGQELNYQSLSKDSGVPARTLEGHIEVLKDTLIGFELQPFGKTLKRKASTKSKFYFFDCGVANYFARRLPLAENSSDLGICFEQFLIQEIRAYLSYNRIKKNITYWRSKDFEVDLIIGQDIALEFKFSQNFKTEFTKGLRALQQEGLIKKFMVVGRFSQKGTSDGIEYLGYTSFLSLLWSGNIC